MPANHSTPPTAGNDNTMLRLIIDAATGMLAYFETGTMRCRFATEAYAGYYGLTASTVLDKCPWEIMGMENWNAIAPHIERCMRGESVHYTYTQRAPQGTLREVEVTITPHLEQERLCGAVVKLEDLGAERSTQQLLRASEERMRKFSEATHEAIVLHRNGQLLDANAALSRLLGYSLEELRGTAIFRLLAPEYWRYAVDVVRNGHDSVYEAVLLHKDGHRIPVEIDVRTIPSAEPGEADHMAVIRDLTAYQQAQAQVRFLTQHDALTRLPNRWHLTERLAQLLDSARRDNTPLAVLSLNLNHFSAINDSLGHEAGDQVLREVAQRLRNGLRDSDLVARAGSDEFITVLTGVRSRTDTETIIRHLTSLLEAPYKVAGHPLVVSPSIGIAMFPEDGTQAEVLLRNAVAAQLLAKENGRCPHQFYTPVLEGRASRLLSEEQLLRQSILHGEFELHYQPQVRTDNGALAGFEALVRWRHPQRGLIGPDEFVHLAEARGLIGALDRWVLRQACDQAQTWHAQGLPRVPMAVNMSAQEFRDPGLAYEVAQVLEETGLPGHLLHIEITESTLMHTDPQIQRTLQQLCQHGVEMAIDDFGTGYSSLAYLRRHPIQQLKIDRSFISDIAADDDAIVKAIVQMASSLRLRTLAEGVETAGQLARLRELGCDMVQGFYIAPPMPAAQAEQWQMHQGPKAQAE